ncbi:MAG: STAS domain-containing protein [Tannerellaceae bacterium]|nr:STAS domain-containing protein [Tannerellaceae bacterium]MCD8263034.1 STAS domain-containing protein [Tannerellaceae bacterium]
MEIIIKAGNPVIISLKGELDTLTATDFEREIQNVINGDCNDVILNGSELDYVSSAGLRLLLTLQKGIAGKGGTLRLQNIKDEIMEIFNITGFSSILTIE